MPRFTLHEAVRAGDLQRVERLLATTDGERALNAPDDSERTPLEHAIVSDTADTSMVRLLLDHGAIFDSAKILGEALKMGVLAKVKVLLEAGADLHYRSQAGYDALLDAVHGRDISRDSDLLELLDFLIGHEVSLDTVSSYGESALAVLSHRARFDAVAKLLDAGAAIAPLHFTELLSAVAFGSVKDLESALGHGADLEARDGWRRTAWLLAVQMGDIDKAAFLRERGADVTAVGNVGRSALAYAIDGHQHDMLSKLLADGADIEQPDQFGATPVMIAVEVDDAESVQLLLLAGASVSTSVIRAALSGGVLHQLLDAVGDERQLGAESQRMLLGYPPKPTEDLPGIEDDDYRHGCHPRYGDSNPELMQVPFWTAMVRSGMTAARARSLFAEGFDLKRNPSAVWSAHRFGQSISLLEDGWVVQIGGEHEDFYDVDFHIYNDVIVHDRHGAVTIYGYPLLTFGPTDFHSATHVGAEIVVIGGLGYMGTREPGVTRVYRLDIATYAMHAMHTMGDNPGWIFEHSAHLIGARTIRVYGGQVVALDDEGKEQFIKNDAEFELDLDSGTWRRTSE